MNKKLLLFNVDAKGARSKSSSRVFDYLFLAQCFRQYCYADLLFSHFQLLHFIFNTYKVCLQFNHWARRTKFYNFV